MEWSKKLRLKKVFCDYIHVLNITQIRSTDKFLFYESQRYQHTDITYFLSGSSNSKSILHQNETEIPLNMIFFKHDIQYTCLFVKFIKFTQFSMGMSIFFYLYQQC